MTAKKHPKDWTLRTVHESDMGEFRDIPDTGGMNKVSAAGVVVSQRRPGLPEGWWVVLRIQKSTNAKPFNRVTIHFISYDEPRICQVSRLILMAWVGPPPSVAHVAAHRNGVTDDDRLENLVWALPRDVKHGQIARGTWTRGSRIASARYAREQVVAARKIVVDYGVPANLLANALGESQVRVREWLTKTWDDGKWDNLIDPLNGGEQ